MNNVLVNYIEVIPEDVARSRRESSQKPSKHVAIPANQQLPSEEQDLFASGEETPDDYEGPEEPPEEEIPPGDFRQIIPQALLDIDCAEDDPRYHQAVQVIQESAAPPTLPMFLGKSILNGNLPMKDDASVLTLPNHTVLNHLATSSVRNGVLATSVTTRYKKKVSELTSSTHSADVRKVRDHHYVQTGSKADSFLKPDGFVLSICWV